MISEGSLLRFRKSPADWNGFETALVLRSYICEDGDCCANDCLAGIDFAQPVEPAQVVDILWDNGQIDTDYHLADELDGRYEVIPP